MKRLLSSILVAIMVLSALPLGVMAEETSDINIYYNNEESRYIFALGCNPSIASGPPPFTQGRLWLLHTTTATQNISEKEHKKTSRGKFLGLCDNSVKNYFASGSKPGKKFLYTTTSVTSPSTYLRTTWKLSASLTL